jgi:hypothetical protein
MRWIVLRDCVALFVCLVAGCSGDAASGDEDANGSGGGKSGDTAGTGAKGGGGGDKAGSGELPGLTADMFAGLPAPSFDCRATEDPFCFSFRGTVEGQPLDGYCYPDCGGAGMGLEAPVVYYWNGRYPQDQIPGLIHVYIEIPDQEPGPFHVHVPPSAPAGFRFDVTGPNDHFGNPAAPNLVAAALGGAIEQTGKATRTIRGEMYIEFSQPESDCKSVEMRGSIPVEHDCTNLKVRGNYRFDVAD